MRTNFLWNPYERIAGFPALILGLLSMAISSFIASTNGIHFDGALDVHLGAVTTWYSPFVENLFNWLLISILAIILSKLFGRAQFRMIDIFGTIALSRAPLILAALMGSLDLLNPTNPYDINNLLIGFVILFIVVWSLALLFHSIRVSANLKNARLWIAFVIIVIGAEIISKLLIPKIYLLIL